MIRVNDIATSQSVVWIKEAFQLFVRQPLQWIVLISFWVMLTFVLLAVPLIGQSFAVLLQPAFSAGFMLAARDQELGQQVTLRHLFAAFNVNGRALVMIGAITLLAGLAATMFLVIAGFPEIKLEKLTQEELLAARKALDGHGWKIGVWFTFLMFIHAILWFVAPLLAFHAIPPTHAIRWSAFAVLSNFAPLLCFWALMLVIFFIALMPWGLGIVIFLPLTVIANYTSYRRVFADA